MKENYSNFNLLKILCMFFIIAGHYVAHSNLIELVSYGSINYFVLQFFRFMIPVSLNCFVLITGYFMVNKNIRSKKIFNLIFTTWLYSVIIYLCYSFSSNSFILRSMIANALPVCTGQYWFISAYLGLYIVIPFINKLLLNLTEKRFRFLLLILTFLYVILHSVFYMNSVYIPTYFSLSWFIYLYILGAYLKLYSKYNGTITKNVLLLSLILIVNILSSYVGKMFFGKHLSILYDYNFIFNMIGTFLLFNIFKKIDIKNMHLINIVDKIVPLILAVYIISDNRVIRMFIWHDIFKVDLFVNSPYMIIHIILTVFIIFLISFAIEIIRKNISEPILENKRLNAMFKRFDSKLN